MKNYEIKEFARILIRDKNGKPTRRWYKVRTEYVRTLKEARRFISICLKVDKQYKSHSSKYTIRYIGRRAKRG